MTTTHITSVQNSTIKRIRQLGTSAKHRQQQGLTLLDGVHLAESYLNAGHQPVQCAVSDSSINTPEVAAIIARLDESVERIEVPDELFSRISTVEHGVGLLFVIRVPEPGKVEPQVEDALLLDGVQDPGNVGTILRTVAAAGAKSIYLSADCSSAWSPRVLRAGMGAHFALDIHEQVDLAELISRLVVPVRATSLAATQTIYEADLQLPVAWVFGSEGRGVSPEVMQLCTDTVIIPQASDVESLNVSASVAICLFEQRRQRQ